MFDFGGGFVSGAGVCYVDCGTVKGNVELVGDALDVGASREGLGHVGMFDLLVKQSEVAGGEVEEIGAEGEVADVPIGAKAPDSSGRDA